jgi:hypothetical protein
VELVQEQNEEFGELLASEFFIQGKELSFLFNMSLGGGVVDLEREELAHNVAEGQRVPQIHFNGMLAFFEIA